MFVLIFVYFYLYVALYKKIVLCFFIYKKVHHRIFYHKVSEKHIFLRIIGYFKTTDTSSNNFTDHQKTDSRQTQSANPCIVESFVRRTLTFGRFAWEGMVVTHTHIRVYIYETQHTHTVRFLSKRHPQMYDPCKLIIGRPCSCHYTHHPFTLYPFPWTVFCSGNYLKQPLSV